MSKPLPPPPGKIQELERGISADKAAAMTRRASMLLLVLGVLVLLASAVCFLTLTVDPQKFIDQFLETAPAAFREQWSHEDLRLIFRVEWAVVGVIALFFGLSLLLSAGPVRRGRRGAVIYAIVMVILCTLACAFNMLAGFVLVLMGGLWAIPGLLIAGCVMAAFVVCLFALFGSYRAAAATIQRQRISLQSLRYPPGYASGYAAQVRTSTVPINIERSSDSAPQTI